MLECALPAELNRQKRPQRDILWEVHFNPRTLRECDRAFPLGSWPYRFSRGSDSPLRVIGSR